jgi:hypothetical protein
MSKSETCCALCMLDGVWSKPINNWPGIPICREHLSETLVRTSGQPAITVPPGSLAAPERLQ